jgi:uncharacterized protein (TIGR02594 family)
MNGLGAYQDLAAELGPPALLEALKLWGVTEVKGKHHNPIIMGWAKELGGMTQSLYDEDEDPWCGLFAGIVIRRAGFKPPGLLVRARAWLDFGSEITVPMLMDVLVFKREGGGHVGFYAGEDDEAFHVLGGNQGDQVKIVRIARDRMMGARRPLYDQTPQMIRRIYRAAQGSLAVALA